MVKATRFSIYLPYAKLRAICSIVSGCVAAANAAMTAAVSANSSPGREALSEQLEVAIEREYALCGFKRSAAGFGPLMVRCPPDTCRMHSPQQSGRLWAKRRHLDLVGPRASGHANPLHRESRVDALILVNDMASFPRDGNNWSIPAHPCR